MDGSRDQKIDKAQGFTLIELAIVLLIFGIIITPILGIINLYEKKKRVEDTNTRIEQIYNTIATFTTRYPCPSNRALPQGDPNYGLEVCDITTIPVCNNSGTQGICRTVGRDTDSDGTGDPVVIGGFPTRMYADYVGGNPATPDLTTLSTLKEIEPTLSNLIGGIDFGMDGWNKRFTYAVSFNRALPGQNVANNFRRGAISAIDEAGNPTGGINGDAQFVIISHGENMNGGFDGVSGAPNACNLAQADGANCDGDATFRQAISFSEGAVAQRFDDFTKFYNLPSTGLWSQIGNTVHITNTNTDNVGVNLPVGGTPLQKLHVNGNIVAPTVRTDLICDIAGNNCIDPMFLFNDLGTCTNGQVITEISNSGITCGRPTFQATAGANEVRCTGSAKVRKLTMTGCIECGDGATICP